MEGCSGQNRPSVSHFERARDGGVEQRGLWTVVAKKTPPPCVSSERGVVPMEGPHHVEGVPFLRAPAIGCWFHLVVSIK